MNGTLPQPVNQGRMYPQRAGLALALACWLLAVQVKANCGSAAASLGHVDCVDLPDKYAGRQWSTCISKDYMHQKSKNRHNCSSVLGQSAFCYYPCMQELYDVDNGIVTSECSCEPEQTTVALPVTPVSTEPAPTKPPLDPQCYSPSGASCLWYGDCLEMEILCSGEEDGYVTQYAENFCNRFETFRKRLSPRVHDWMDAARQCLQVSLVPSLRPFENQTCWNLKQLAYRSYRDCYMNPFPGAPSLCELSDLDTWHMFWILKEPLASDFYEALFELYKLSKQCTWRQSNLAVVYGTTFLLKIDLDIGSLPHRGPQIHSLAAELCSAFASRLGWLQRGIIWFAFGQKGDNSTLAEAYILLADKRRYDLQVEPQDNDRPLDMDSLLNATATAFADGRLNQITLGGQPVQLLALTSCDDDACTKSRFTVKAPVNGSDVTRVSHALLRLLVMWAFLRKLF